jgi:proteic killer suppression protein
MNRGGAARSEDYLQTTLPASISSCTERLQILSYGVIIPIVIKTFQDEETEKIFRGSFSRKFPRGIQRLAARKLEQIDAATVLDTLRIPPGNHLEALKGDRRGQHSIRINGQWRVCFVWREGNAFNVEIVDYH